MRFTRWRPTSAGRILLLSLERLQALCEQPLQRVGLSATQKPIDAVARYLVGLRSGWRAPAPAPSSTPAIGAPRDLALEVPSSPLEAVMSAEVWDAGLRSLERAHRCAPHHAGVRQHAAPGRARHAARLRAAGARARRRAPRQSAQGAEARRRTAPAARGIEGLVATASLELGIDIGEVDLVCQIGSPRSIASFLQRVGRSGHAVGGNAEGSALPVVARRSRRVHGADRQRQPRRARSAGDP